ncbi:MAG: ImmA/IrrE family metallo-endopeptidase [Alcaligenaceae bacterium]|nr:MAG: ImmA/IrrE family metallo-endopeptidase [Alcaligenaceae bacterium]
MERITDINPQRVEWCLADLGLTPEQVAVETGLAPEKIQAVLDGDGALTFGQLRALAEYLGRSVLFFLEPAPVNAERVHSPQFRTLAGQKPDLSRRVRHLVQRAERQRTVYADLVEDLEGVERPRFDPPVLPADPIAAARIARTWLALGDHNNFESYRSAVEDKGVLVFRTNGYAGKWQIAKESPILGFALYDAVLPVIVVKKQDAEARQSFTLMHELGHVLLHRMSSVDDEADMRAPQGMEREANQFAAHLLVPDTFLATIRDTDRPEAIQQLDEWLKPQRRAWGVSTDAILLRLVGADRLSQAVYGAYRAWRAEQPQRQDDGGSRAHRYREPRHVFGDRFVRTVLGALDARQITLSKASDYLDGLKVSDLHKLERFYAGV